MGVATHEARRVVFVLAGAALFCRLGEANVVHNAVANVARLHALVLGVYVLLPYLQRLQHWDVAVRQH